MTVECLFCGETLEVPSGQVTVDEAGMSTVELECTATKIKFHVSWEPTSEPEKA